MPRAEVGPLYTPISIQCYSFDTGSLQHASAPIEISTTSSFELRLYDMMMRIWSIRTDEGKVIEPSNSPSVRSALPALKLSSRVRSWGERAIAALANARSDSSFSALSSTLLLETYSQVHVASQTDDHLVDATSAEPSSSNRFTRPRTSSTCNRRL